MILTRIGQSAGKTVVLQASWIGALSVGEGCFSLSVRQSTTQKGTRVLSILPSFQLSMSDRETMELVDQSLTHHGIAHGRIFRKRDGMMVVSIHGLKRLNVFLPWILPHLTGDKRRSAQHVYDYVQYRLSLPPKTPVAQIDLDYLYKARSLNGNSGAKWRAIPEEYLNRILRDSTPRA